MKPKETASQRLRVYIVEDDDDLREEIVYSLARLDMDITGLASAPEFYKAHALARCDIAVLDIGLSGEDGLSIAANLRATGPIGIIMVTARGAVQDRIDAAHKGADTYMVKPVNVEELAANIRALGARVRAVLAPPPPAAQAPAPAPAPAPAGKWRLTQGDWVLCDPNGTQLTLTTAERAFLACLFKSLGKPVSREQLIVAMGGSAESFDPQRVDAIASRVRRKAAREGLKLPMHSVRGTGYLFAK